VQNNKPPMIAAIDVGTNSFHMVIASANHRGMLNIIGREKEMVRLGSGSSDLKIIQPDAMQRGLTTLCHFTEIAKSENAEIRAVATSAVREALNSHEFLDKVKNEIGIDIEVVSGTEEARLIYQGILHALPVFAQRTLVMDIGGGSTETAVGYQGEIQYVHSAKLGAIRLSKRFFNNSETTKAEIEECREYIKGDWAPIFKRIIENGF